jgi:hypothetical protein
LVAVSQEERKKRGRIGRIIATIVATIAKCGG